MIIFRYLSKQILFTMTSVTILLMVIALTNRFIQYLGRALAGEMSTDVLLQIMFYRLPDFLIVIIPLAFLLAILLAYGRMYAENEMTVLHTCGMSRNKLLGLTLLCSSFVMVLTAVLSLLAAPWGLRHVENIMQDQERLTELDLMTAGRFYESSDRVTRVTYAERIDFDSTGHRRLENVFVVLGNSSAQSDSPLRVLISDSARPETDAATGKRFMVMENVYQYKGNPGDLDYDISQSSEYIRPLKDPVSLEPVLEDKALTTGELWSSSSIEHQAELQSRVSVILMIPVIALIAVALCKVDPRQGRFSKLPQATFLFAIYYGLLQTAEGWVAAGEVPVSIGIWWVHLLFLLTGGLLMHGLPFRQLLHTARVESGSK